MNEQDNSKKKWRRWMMAAALLVCAAEVRSDGTSLLIPGLHAGQEVKYRCTARLERKTKTESRIATMLQNPDLFRDLSGEIGLLVKQVRMDTGKPVVSALARWIDPDAPAGGANPEKGAVEIKIGADGNLTEAKGLDDLDADQRVAWQFWLGRFAQGWTLPAGVKLGDKWKTVEEEKAASPIAGLYWERETTYAQDDVCPVVPAETCAVFLTEATLKQRSSTKDATPDDYKARELKTAGSAKGTNQTITYISKKTGLLVRAKEDAAQEMDVVIMKTDRSNGVYYKVGASSHQETVLEVGEEGKGKR